MPITKQDVLDVLRDPAIRSIRFSTFGGIFVNAYQYDKVADYVASGGIKVVPGDKTLAEYDNSSDTLHTQKGELAHGDFEGRALLLHECTHAILDIDRVKVRRLVGEAVAYLAQFTYRALVDPSQPLPPRGSGMDADDQLTLEAMNLVNLLHLADAAGFGKEVSDADINNFADQIFDHPKYAARIKNKSEMLDSDGVSLTDDQEEDFQELRAISMGTDPLFYVVAPIMARKLAGWFHLD
jgi:hypothetical protein